MADSKHSSEWAKGLRVLLAEDDELITKVLLIQLARAGFEVQTAANGEEAAAAAAASRYDLILMDCDMPTVDGFEATRAIRERERAAGVSRVPILAMTGFTGSEIEGRCRAAGMDQVLIKPISLSELSVTLRKWMPAGVAAA